MADHLQLRIELDREIFGQGVLLHRQASGRGVRDGPRSSQSTPPDQGTDRLIQWFRAQPMINQLTNRRVEQSKFIPILSTVFDTAPEAVRRLKIHTRQQQRQQNL